MNESVQIKGAHRGYKHGALFELTNGRTWVQTSYQYQYLYSYRPSAELEIVGSRGRIKVEGHDDWVDVRKV
jgi:hypothetical protein